MKPADLLSFAAAAVVATWASAANDPHAAAPDVTALTPQQAIARLTEGNARFVEGSSQHPNLDQDRRCLTFQGQHPFASILSCSDSRAPVELLFDQGIGDLFTIRVAGNVADVDEIATIEYGVGHLNTPLVVVLGHTKCGAVTAVVDGAGLHGNLALLTDNIQPAAERAKRDHPELQGAALVPHAIKANVHQAMADLLSKSDEVRAAAKSGKVNVIGAVYDIHSGQVQWLGEHPQQAALLAGAAVAPPTKAHHADPAHDAHHDDHGGHAKPAPHGGHSDASPHDASHAEELAVATGAKPRPMAASQEYMILAAFLAGSATASGLVLRLMKKKKKSDA